MAANKMDMNVKKGIVYAQNYIGGEFEDAAAGYVDSHNPVRMKFHIFAGLFKLQGCCNYHKLLELLWAVTFVSSVTQVTLLPDSIAAKCN